MTTIISQCAAGWGGGGEARLQGTMGVTRMEQLIPWDEQGGPHRGGTV